MIDYLIDLAEAAAHRFEDYAITHDLRGTDVNKELRIYAQQVVDEHNREHERTGIFLTLDKFEPVLRHIWLNHHVAEEQRRRAGQETRARQTQAQVLT